VSLYFTNKLLRDKNLFFSLLLGLSLSLSFLSGNYQISMMVYVIVFIYFIGHLEIKNIFKKDQLILTGFFLIAIIFSTLLISVQLIPTMEYLSQTLRTVKGVDYKEATKDSLGLKEIIMLFIPDYYGLPWQNPHYTGKIYHWEACYYIGIFPFLLTLIGFILRGKEKRNLYIWAIIILLGFIMALGKHMPLYKFLFNYVPLFKSYRVPIRFLFFIFPGLLYYTGFSLNQLLNLPKPVNWKNYKNILITLIFCGIFILFLSFFSFIHGNISFFFIFTGLGGILTIYLKLSGKIKRNVFAVITITLLITSAFSFGLIYNPTRDQAYFKERSSIFTPLENKIPPARMYYLIPPELLGHLHGTRNMASTKRICSLLGYNPLILQRYASYLLYASSGKMLSSLDPESLGKFDLIHLDNLDSSMMKLLNLKYVYIFMQREKYENNIIDLKNPYERAFIVRDYKVIKEDNKILEMLKSKEFNPEKILILKEDPGVKTKNQELVEEKVSITEFEPDYIRIEINPEVKEPSLLFLSEIYYPGWKAKVHGEERKVYRANYLFRAISLKQGDKIVEFYFSPDSFKIGVLITITSLLFLLIVIIKTFLSTYRKKKE
ncbi:MAG TPA: YfhO family protein, partial [Candidatus Eremiobacteraeota bacterium]|nr:YfhO family protein [Candidatus Eremiobacteraeota bacterium]